MKGVILDADSLGSGIDLTPVTSLLDDWQVYPTTSADNLASRLARADVVLSNKIALTSKTLNTCDSLRFISVMATGTNNVDLEAARRLNITVSNAVAYGTPSVVQHVLSLLLMLATNVHRYVGDVANGRWQQSPVFTLLDHPIIELHGKTLGIVGYGELGKGVANAASALGLKVLTSEHPGIPEDETRTGRTVFDRVLSEADFVTLHCPLTPETANLINAGNLKKMKRSAFLVNTARGGLVDSTALLDALDNGLIAGAAIDVLDTEPPGANEPLLNRPDLSNLIITPHNAWGAIESRTRLVGQMRENIMAFLAGNPTRRVV